MVIKKLNKLADISHNDLCKTFRSMESEFMQDGTIVGKVVERHVTKLLGGQFIDDEGYDFVLMGKKIEVKCTTKPKKNTNEMRIGNTANKEGKCDYVIIIDRYFHKSYCIPHDDFFSQAQFDKDEFRWSGTLNECDNIRPDNSNLLKKYLIKI